MRLFKRPGALLTTLLFLVIGAAFLTQVVPYRQIVDSHRQVAAARAELAALEEENQRLQVDVAALHTDSEIEKLAREKLGYVRPGETAFIVLDPPDSSKEPQPDPPDPPQADEDKTWVDRLWDFITGADLES